MVGNGGPLLPCDHEHKLTQRDGNLLLSEVYTGLHMVTALKDDK